MRVCIPKCTGILLMSCIWFIVGCEANQVSFFIGGAMKAGTTSLREVLNEHPQICMMYSYEGVNGKKISLHGEPHYWGNLYKEVSFKKYNMQCEEDCLCGDGTPSYMYKPDVPERTSKKLPDAKWIILLREPVSRTFSQYKRYVRKQNEKHPEKHILTFEAKLAKERQEFAVQEVVDGFPFHKGNWQLMRSYYDFQIERVWKYFPKDQVLILFSEELHAEGSTGYKTILKFLGVDPDVTLTNKDEIPNPGQKMTMDPETEKELCFDFALHNKRLENMLGRKTPWTRCDKYLLRVQDSVHVPFQDLHLLLHVIITALIIEAFVGRCGRYRGMTVHQRKALTTELQTAHRVPFN